MPRILHCARPGVPPGLAWSCAAHLESPVCPQVAERFSYPSCAASAWPSLWGSRWDGWVASFPPCLTTSDGLFCWVLNFPRIPVPSLSLECGTEVSLPDLLR